MDIEDTIIKTSNIMVLHGVNMDKIDLDESFDQKFMEHLVRAVPNLYSEIPKTFTDMTLWPKTSNLKCWECSENFISHPVFVPTNVYENENGFKTFDVCGNFCSWNCVVKYIEKTYPKHKHWDYMRYVRIVYKLMNGRSITKITPALDKTCMKQYCGNEGITCEEFRQKMNLLFDY